MTANQRRPGFRLPWSSELGDASDEAEAEAPDSETAAPTSPPETNGSATIPSTEAPRTVPAPVVAAAPATRDAAASPDFMRELVSAMRKVADEARETGVTDARSRAEAQVSRLEAAAERRRAELQASAERDVAGVGEWAQAEAARIKREAEQKVAARRAELEQQLAADDAHVREESTAVREQATAYERELEAYHAQLLEIEDPTAFAAAAKRMPQPPIFVTPADAETMSAVPATDSSPAEAAAPEAAADVHPAEEEVLTTATTSAGEAPVAPPAAAAAATPDAAPAVRSEPITTDVVVKGLGSFGAITGFRQTLAAADGIDGVALSLGQTGEFVFRATHQPTLDVADVIRGLEGEGARVEAQGERSYLVTLDKAR
jgi:hypothetical protein